ncbi:MAG TPA: DMT family transporter [Gaiellaceae bacterium]|nr:DMT family transporter [Gaiellaceae bacterium]
MGYGLALTAAAIFGIGGIVAKLGFRAGFEPSQLAELRIIFSFLLLLVVLAVFRRSDLAVRRTDLPMLALFGVLGIGGVQLSYYESIQRLPIGVALVIQYTAPLLLLLYARATGKRVDGRLWVAALLTIAGCALVVGLYDESLRAVNTVGALLAVLSAVIFAVYFILAERVLATHRPWTALLYGLGFALIAWAILRPVWLLPWDLAAAHWPLVAGIAILTATPFALTLTAVSLIPPARVGLTSTFEPVVAAIAAFFILAEALEPLQLVGGAVVLVGIVIAQSLRVRAGGV